ncbi:hypothetical protein BDA96_08G183300 [Sorghum bicolor]|uniref:Uncharacterized protein n=2 Tax=Sorghum bicolor TaxID=4558 RepID=A0A921U7Y2_SORBI|nr:hypothetical protein BDA96_08G183300 [Sorghum bicolor]KXG23972.1 hypothetical protein SORBI_3008G166000 [Sorghum bicolor]
MLLFEATGSSFMQPSSLSFPASHSRSSQGKNKEKRCSMNSSAWYNRSTEDTVGRKEGWHLLVAVNGSFHILISSASTPLRVRH